MSLQAAPIAAVIPALWAGLVAVIGVVVTLYWVGVVRLWRNAGIGRGISRWASTGFVVALAILVGELGPPFDDWADESVAAHMIQHLVLLIVLPVGIVVGRPVVAFAWMLPRSYRGFSRRLSRLSPGDGPTVVGLIVILHVSAIFVWHTPRMFDLAVRHEGVHLLDHASLAVRALAFWWLTLHADRHGSSGLVGALLATAAVGVASTALGLAMTFADTPWYGSAGGAWLRPRADQQTAGALMWGAGGLVYALMFSLLTYKLMRGLGAHGSRRPLSPSESD